MDPEFWSQRWCRKDIGFHRSAVHPMLRRHWSTLSPSNDEAVLVPLCGKSLDLVWLSGSGGSSRSVIGVELSEIAVEAFFDAHGLDPHPTRIGGLDALQADGITLCIGDFFEFDPPHAFPLVYDRAAMIALPAASRTSYRRKLRSLVSDDARGLLITLEYPQSEMDGPPFAVGEDELGEDPHFDYDVLERSDADDQDSPLGKRGLSRLSECAIRMTVSKG